MKNVSAVSVRVFALDTILRAIPTDMRPPVDDKAGLVARGHLMGDDRAGQAGTDNQAIKAFAHTRLPVL